MTKESFDISGLHEKKQQEELFDFLEERNLEREEIIKSLNKDWKNIEGLSSMYRRDPEIVMIAFLQCVDSLHFAHPDLLKNKFFITKLVEINQKAFKYADDKLRCDKDFIRDLFFQGLEIWHYVHPDIIKDEEFVMSTIKKGYESQASLNDTEDEFSQDKKEKSSFTIENGVSKTKKNLMDELLGKFSSKKKALELVKENWENFAIIPKKYRKDKDVALEALSKNFSAMMYIDESLLNDKHFILEAINKGILKILLESSWKIREDKDFLMPLIISNPKLYEFIGPSLMEDVDFNLELMENNIFVAKYFVDEMKNNLIIAKEIIIRAANLYIFSSRKQLTNREVIDILDESEIINSCLGERPQLEYPFLVTMGKMIIEINNLRRKNCNNRHFMKGKIRENIIFYNSLGNELKNDKNFMKELKEEFPNITDFS